MTITVGESVSVAFASVGDDVVVTAGEGADEDVTVGSEDGINVGMEVFWVTSAMVGDKVESEGALEGDSVILAVVPPVGVIVVKVIVGEPVAATGGSEGMNVGDDVCPSVGDSVVLAIVGLTVGDRVAATSVTAVVGAPVTDGSVAKGGGESSSVGVLVVMFEGAPV